jgi:hypothetical protein
MDLVIKYPTASFFYTDEPAHSMSHARGTLASDWIANVVSEIYCVVSSERVLSVYLVRCFSWCGIGDGYHKMANVSNRERTDGWLLYENSVAEDWSRIWWECGGKREGNGSNQGDRYLRSDTHPTLAPSGASGTDCEQSAWIYKRKWSRRLQLSDSCRSLIGQSSVQLNGALAGTVASDTERIAWRLN